MPPQLFRDWRTGWRLRRGTTMYVSSLRAEPDAHDVEWLASVATGGDLDRARWELRYARRALGLLIAERDALDDRTGSLVAREMADSHATDRNVAAGMVGLAERQFNSRLSAYRTALSARSGSDGTATRLGRALLSASSSLTITSESIVAHAGELLAGYAGAANESLRKAFGAAQLPEDKPPSSLASRSTP